MKILIVDDNRDDRRLLRYIVEKKGHQPIEAEDGLEGLRMAKLHMPDLIISDALMPIMDGYQFLKSVKEDERLKTIPFIFYSAIYKADKDVDLAIALGAEAYIIKPKEPVDLWDEVEIILQGRKEKVITPELITEEEDYLKRYSQVVAAKLEEKVAELQKEVAERKRAEEESRKAKEEWERTFDAITDPLMILDVNHKIIKANTAMAAAMKVAPQEAIGLTCYKAVHGMSEAPSFCPHSRLLEDGQPHSAEVSEPRMGGHFIVSVSPLFTPEGTLYGSIHYARDITERKAKEEDLRRTNELLERVFSTTHILIAYLDREFNFIKVNNAYAEADGRDPSFFSGKNHFALYPDNENEAIFRNVLKTGKPFIVYEKRFVYAGHPERGVTYWDWSLVPVLGGSGEVESLVLSLKDVTERKRAEERNRQLASIVESSDDAIISKTLDGVILTFNEGAEVIYGYTAEEIKGRPISVLVPPDRSDDVPRILSKIMMGEHLDHYETVRIRKDGVKIDVSLTVSPIRDAAGAVVGASSIARDITARKRAEAELVRLYQQVKDEAEISTSLLSTFQALNSSLDERELIKTVLDVAPSYLKFDRMAIFVYDEGLRGFVFSGGYGFRPDEEGMLLSRCFKPGDFPAMDRAIKGETVMMANAVESDLISKELVDTFGIRAAVIVPISAREKVIGGIYADFNKPGPIEKRDILFLKGLSDGIAVALQNSRLYRDSIERLMDLSAKIETIKAMGHLEREILSTIDRGTILRTAVALVSRIMPCERASVLLREGANFRVISEWGVGGFLDNVYSVKKSHFEAPGIKSGSLFIPDLGADATDCPYHREQYAIGIKSSLLVPLVSQNETIGLLDIGSTFHGRLAPSHLSTAENIASQITVALENARLYEEVQQLLINTITSLAAAIDAKSPWTKGHSERVTRYALQIGQEMGLQEKDLERLKLSGLLHDVGKIGTYDILLDKPTRLTDEEFAMVKRHPHKGAEILGPIKQLSDIIPGVRHHHERYDGKGYPDGLKGEEIPLQARILCVADSFDSMTADRPYRPSPGKEYAISEFRRCSGTQFDPKVVEVFLRVLKRQ
jgi:PAS domain S-box-containing protein